MRVIFPPILLWDLIKFGANVLLGKLAGSVVLPAQDMVFRRVAKPCIPQQEMHTLSGEFGQITTHDGVILNSFEVEHQSQNNMSHEYKKYIINFVGNGMSYYDICDEIIADAKALEINVIGFDFRGVNQSSGRAQSKDDLVTDGIAQVQRLLVKGVSPQNITLKGHSLGAAVATLVTQHFHQLGQPINLFNGRSFSSLTNVLVGHIRLKRNDTGHKDSTGGIIVGWLLYPIFKFTLALIKWEIDAGSAFKSIPEAYKDYIVVRSPNAERATQYDDTVIPHYASIHAALHAERCQKKAEIAAQIENIHRQIQRSSDNEDLVKQNALLVEDREKIKNARKMQAPEQYKSYGHMVGLPLLKNKLGIHAQKFFQEFYVRTTKAHGISKTNSI